MAAALPSDPPTTPYRAFGLRRNPFAWIDGRDAGPFLDHLQLTPPRPGSRRFHQVLGPEGSGKTSHLQAWRASEPGPYYEVNVTSSDDPPIAPIAYWDEADRLADRHLRRVLRRAGAAGATIVAATHRDLGALARRSGLHVETVEMEPLTEGLLRRWADTRVDAARIDGGIDHSIAFSDDEIRAVLGQCETLREAGDEFHRLVAERVRSG